MAVSALRHDDEHDDVVTSIENIRTELREEIADVQTDLGGRIDRIYDLSVERDGRVAAP